MDDRAQLGAVATVNTRDFADFAQHDGLVLEDVS